MDFKKLMNVASQNERNAQKHLMNSKSGLSTKLAPLKKEMKSACKGVQSAAVRAFLERREKEESEKAAAEQLKKDELLRLRHEAQHDRKAHAMASRTKDNLKVLADDRDRTSEPAEAQDNPVVDLKHLFTKHDRRVPHLPSEKIPDMLSAMKERQKQRRLEQEKAKKAAEEAEAAKMRQQKLNIETSMHEHKRKKVCIAPPSSVSVSDRKRHGHSPSASVSILPKFISADKEDVESMGKVNKKKQHPPPMSFEQLMSLAQQKQAEPIVDTQPPSVSKKKVSAEQERPMTQEEKDRQKRRETKEYQDWLKYGGPAPSAPSSGKSRHQQQVRESHTGQKAVSAAKVVAASDAFDDSDFDSETEHAHSLHKVNGMRSYPYGTTSRLKDDDNDALYKQSSVTKADSRQRSVEASRQVSRGEVPSTKGKSVMTSAKGSETGQNGKSKSLSDELIEKLKEERRRMVESGDAVPSLADMLQDLLNKVHGSETSSQETTTFKQPLSSGTSSNPSSSNAKSKLFIYERKAESSSIRPQSSVASGASRSSGYVTVNETVLDCARDKSSSAKPGDKRPMKSTWEEMYQRAKSKNPNLDHQERKAVKRSRQNYDPSDDEDEDEDEDDEFMGDFIDDGSDTERTDYSHYIRQLFGYDRRKFANEKDDDLRGMESSYSQQLKEDAVSTKLGLLEDLEDMRREEEEKRQQMGKLKAKKPRLK